MMRSSFLLHSLFVCILLVVSLALLVESASSSKSSSSNVATRLASRGMKVEGVQQEDSSNTHAASLIPSAAELDLASAALNQFIIDYVNALPEATWTAGTNDYFEGKSMEFVKKSCGFKMDTKMGGSQDQININNPWSPTPIDPNLYINNNQPYYPSPYSPYTPTNPETTPVPTPVPADNTPAQPSQPIPDLASLPESFDSRTEWGSMCPSVHDIRDQAGCGSCWAVSSAEVMTDRTCISSKGERKPYLSAKNILTCCGLQCGSCEGGYPINAFQMWSTTGVVTGGSYNTSETCQPYYLEPCEHHTKGSRPQCVPQTSTPTCEQSCVNGAEFPKDKHFGKAAYQLPNHEAAIMKEIMTNGPIVAGFMVYADFPHYKSGVYRHVQGSMVGGHAIKLMGWGVENNTKYWLAANSWNTNWGEDGYFKIARGVNEGMIEDMAFAGLPV